VAGPPGGLPGVPATGRAVRCVVLGGVRRVLRGLRLRPRDAAEQQRQAEDARQQPAEEAEPGEHRHQATTS
jgi:hypothetical protein